MAKPKSIAKPRQIRVQISGGIEDIAELSSKIKKIINSHSRYLVWDLEFEETTRFGNSGPLHKTNLGFTQHFY